MGNQSLDLRHARSDAAFYLPCALYPGRGHPRLIGYEAIDPCP